MYGAAACLPKGFADVSTHDKNFYPVKAAATKFKLDANSNRKFTQSNADRAYSKKKRASGLPPSDSDEQL